MAPDKGFAGMPMPDPGDVYFDMEGLKRLAMLHGTREAPSMISGGAASSSICTKSFVKLSRSPCPGTRSKTRKPSHSTVSASVPVFAAPKLQCEGRLGAVSVGAPRAQGSRKCDGDWLAEEASVAVRVLKTPYVIRLRSADRRARRTLAGACGSRVAGGPAGGCGRTLASGGAPETAGGDDSSRSWSRVPRDGPGAGVRGGVPARRGERPGCHGCAFSTGNRPRATG